MDPSNPERDLPVDVDEVRRVLRDSGARFAFVHGSRVHHVVRSERLATPETNADAMLALARHGLLDVDPGSDSATS